MIASPNHESRHGATVRLVVLHTAEGAATTAELGRFFADPTRQRSSHVGIDDNGIESYVDYSQAAWTMLSANPIADQAELCGFADWSRDTWLRQHAGMLTHAAAWVRERCAARGIPCVKLTPAQVGAGHAGVCGHIDWTLGTGEGTHTDPGEEFPWDVVMALATAGPMPPAPAAPPPSDLEDFMIVRCQPDKSKPAIWTALWSGPIFVGVASPGELASAQAAVTNRVAAELWVELVTWNELDRRSHALCGTPLPPAVPPVVPSPPH